MQHKQQARQSSPDAYAQSAANNGMAPMRYACDEGHIVLCQWLVRVGALNQASDDDEVHEDYFGDGHVDQAIVAHDVRDNRPALLEWALDAIAINHQYRDTVLRGSIIHVDSHQQASPANRCRLPMLPSGVLERVGRFVGVVMERQLRNVREFAEALAALPLENEIHAKAVLRDALGAVPMEAPMMIWEDEIDLGWSDEERADVVVDEREALQKPRGDGAVLDPGARAR